MHRSLAAAGLPACRPLHLPCQTGSLAALVATVRTCRPRFSLRGLSPTRQARSRWPANSWGFVCPRRPVLPAWPKPGGPVSPAPMESVDRWPLASITAQIPGGRPSVVAAVRRRDRGRLPSFRGADAAAGPRPFWALGRVSCARTVPGELSGGNWNGREGPAVRPRASSWPGACRPCQR